MYSAPHTDVSRRPHAREVYSVQGTRVTLEPDHHWHCTCRHEPSAGECSHIAQARVYRDMRGPKRDEDTIELELGAAQLRLLTSQTPVVVVKSQRPRRRRHRLVRVSWWGAVAAMASIAAVSSGITYLATATPTPIPVVEQTPVLEEELRALPAEETPPADEPKPTVRFVNPFDASEVFEFPASTSEGAMREAVAALLLERGRERLATLPDLNEGARNAGKRDKAHGPVALVQRS